MKIRKYKGNSETTEGVFCGVVLQNQLSGVFEEYLLHFLKRNAESEQLPHLAGKGFMSLRAEMNPVIKKINIPCVGIRKDQVPLFCHVPA